MTPRDIKPGLVFGRLTALEKVADHPSAPRWRFQCACGTIKDIHAGNVTRSAVRSCGCLHLERCGKGLNQLKHGDARTGQVVRLHSIWRGMLNRCKPGNSRSATKRYAARGIVVCAEWSDYSTFKAWAMANGYAETLTIERIDNDGPYSPDNCRWATKQEQCRNRSTSRRLTVGDRTQVLAAWLEQGGVSPSAFHNRIKRGWPLARALNIELTS